MYMFKFPVMSVQTSRLNSKYIIYPNEINTWDVGSLHLKQEVRKTNQPVLQHSTYPLQRRRLGQRATR